MIELNKFLVDYQVTETNKLRGITEMIFNLNELDNTDNLEDGRPSNSLFITHISLEYDIVTQPDHARFIKAEYDKMVLLYDRVIQHSQIPVNKSDTKWNWAINDTCKSLKGILVLFEEEKPYL